MATGTIHNNQAVITGTLSVPTGQSYTINASSATQNGRVVTIYVALSKTSFAAEETCTVIVDGVSSPPNYLRFSAACGTSVATMYASAYGAVHVNSDNKVEIVLKPSISCKAVCCTVTYISNS